MGIATEEREIGGLTFAVTQLPYFKAQRLFVKLLHLAGPALTGLFTIAGAKDAKTALAVAGDLEVAQLAPLLATFFDRLEPDAVEAISKDILSTTRVKHNDKWALLVGVMDAIVGGDFWTGLTVQAFALSVHFGNFSSARDALEALGLKAEEDPPSEESTTSTDGKAAPSSSQSGARSASSTV